jgi:ABC-2 type transport system ATP-binding protein
LHVETFLLDLKNRLACAAADRLPVPAARRHTLEVRWTSHGHHCVVHQLALQNIEVLSLRNKTNRLEELFVSLVEKICRRWRYEFRAAAQPRRPEHHRLP